MFSNSNPFLINSYRRLTWPYRAYRQWICQSREEWPISIVYYHRIADSHLNPWTLSRRDFVEQLDWFQSQFEIISLRDAQFRMAAGINPRPALAITFDDGYAENEEFAIPELLKRKLPCTYFVALAHIETGKPFDHDLKQGTPLPVNSLDSLRAMSKAGIEIGAHSRTHPDLARVPNIETLIDEVVTATFELSDRISQAIRYFAFPFGLKHSIHPSAFQLAFDAGLSGVCSAYGGYNYVGGNPFHLKRFHADPDLCRLQNWLTFDPRFDRPSGDPSNFDPVEDRTFLQIARDHSEREDAKFGSPSEVIRQ